MIFHLVTRIDDHDEDTLNRFRLKRELSAYVYNPKQPVHCCEVTPSYELNYAFSILVFQDDVTDEQREAIEEELSTVWNEPVIYVHCSGIDKMPLHDDVQGVDTTLPYRVKVEWPDFDDPDEEIERVVDHVRGNCGMYGG